ncbi:PTS transporter subunit EIIC [Spiroplasma alleghenense]|uniref:PTS system, glucose-specific IIBC component n=1 Tax=Spiroplasma alleghenense TaxID=216931 RepID=A0A345Z3M2_9MOLU|nr:PTS transporter subunit EIIC [Spiroplasma alleghenense]AXK51201.1 PTS system, glucose-specific IIBC component [Spiroplasma alleghenense]
MSNQEPVSNFAIKDFNKVIVSGFFQKIGSSLFVVVILMPFFGLSLSIANIITNISHGPNQASNVFNIIGGILFKNLGLFFCLALILGFTKNKGFAILSGVLGYFVFIAFMGAFIVHNNNGTINIWFYKNQQSKLLLDSFYGLETLQTGVLGGMVVGIVVILAYNKLKDFQMPSYLTFIAKERFVLLITPILAILLGVIFILVWPIFVIGLNIFGNWTTKLPFGIDSFIFKFIQRVLVVFQGQVIWHGPFWWTSVGGSLIDYQYLVLQNYVIQITSSANKNLFAQWEISEALVNQDLINEVIYKMSLNSCGDFIPLVENWWQGTGVNFWSAQGDQIASVLVLNNSYVNIQDFWNVGLKLTRFTSGGFSNSMIVLPAIGASLFFSLDKNERKQRKGYYLMAILMSALLGITEPIEFLFLYSNPIIYFGFYAPMAGLQAMIANLLEIKIGSTFSTGLLDFATNGIIPSLANGDQDMKIWYIFIIGLVFALISFLTFFYLYKKDVWKKTLIQDISILKMKNRFLQEKHAFQILNLSFRGIKNISKVTMINDESLEIELKVAKIDLQILDKYKFIKSFSITEKRIIFKFDKSQITYAGRLWIYSLNKNQENFSEDREKYLKLKKEFKATKLV